jgi:hypothetical protein
MANVEAATAATPATGRVRQPASKPSAKRAAAKHAAKSANRKLKQKRKRRERIHVPADKRWLSWEEAESVSGLCRNSLRPHIREIGAKKVGNRTIIDRFVLDPWLASRPSASP